MTISSKDPEFISNEKSEANIVLKIKINYELLWQTLFIFVTIASAVLLHKIYLYQTLPQFQSIRKGSIFDLLLFGIPSGVLFIYLETIFHNWFDNQIEQHFINHLKYSNEQVRKKRCYKISKWALSLMYYSLTSIFGYLIIKDTSFMPSWLGGQGNCTDLSRYIQNLDEGNSYMKVFYVLQFGKHLGRLIHHCFFKHEGSFYQYALHHGLSTFLIFFSYLMNMWLIGIFVLLIHDLSDIFLILSRAYRDCKRINKKVLLFLDIFGFTVWIGCRLVLLSYCCVYSSISTAYQFWKSEETHNTKIYEVLFVPGVFMGFMLFSLLILQLFWTYHIFCSVLTSNMNKKLFKKTYE